MLLISLVAGLGALMLSLVRIDSPLAATRPVVVAATDLEPGSRLVPQQLTVLEWPVGSVPAGAFGAIPLLTDRVLRSSTLRGEPIVASRLAPEGASGGLSAVIAEGKRAMTVRVNDVVGVAGFALPGNHVDVLVNARLDQGGETRVLTRVVLEHVLVLAVAQESGRDETRPRVVNAVTLELTPAETEALDLARNVGTLSLVLRNQFDRGAVASRGLTVRELLGVPAAPAVATRVLAPPRTGPTVASLPAAPQARNCVEIVRVGQTSTSCFDQ
jgi:pilus assembly protein CpaB